MPEAVDLIGSVKLIVYILTPSRSSYDIVGRLCTVTPFGRSYNVCEGLTTVSASALDGSQDRSQDGAASIASSQQSYRRVEVSFGSTACTVPRGHRLRLHVSSSAHPRWMRNVGNADIANLHKAVIQSNSTTVDLQVSVSADAPSYLLLPIHRSHACEPPEGTVK